VSECVSTRDVLHLTSAYVEGGGVRDVWSSHPLPLEPCRCAGLYHLAVHQLNIS
jgi:hypothetical protein